MLKTISLPYKCLLPLVKKPELLKAFLIWGKLKLLFSNSAIHNIKSRKYEIACLLGISENTFRKYLSILKSKYMVWEDGNGILRIANKYIIYEILKISPNYSKKTGLIRDKKFRLTLDELHIDNIKLLALDYHRSVINYKNSQRIQDQLLETYGKIECPTIQRKIKAIVSKKANSLIEYNKKNPAVGYKSDSKIGFVDDNISSQTISSLFGYRSKMTGNRFMRRLKNDSIIEYERRHILLNKIEEYTDISSFQESQVLPVVIVKEKGCSYLALRIPNSWNRIPIYNTIYNNTECGNSHWTFI